MGGKADDVRNDFGVGCDVGNTVIELHEFSKRIQEILDGQPLVLAIAYGFMEEQFDLLDVMAGEAPAVRNPHDMVDVLLLEWDVREAHARAALRSGGSRDVVETKGLIWQLGGTCTLFAVVLRRLLRLARSTARIARGEFARTDRLSDCAFACRYLIGRRDENRGVDITVAAAVDVAGKNSTVSSSRRSCGVAATVPVKPCEHISIILVSVRVIAVVLATFQLLLVGLEGVDNAVMKLAVGLVLVITLPARVLPQQEVDLRIHQCLYGQL